MEDYKKMYLTLFNAITDGLEALAKGDLLSAKQLLMAAQQKTEEIYME